MRPYVKILLIIGISFTFICPQSAEAVVNIPSAEIVDCYTPVEGGWRIKFSSDANAPRLEPGSEIGVIIKKHYSSRSARQIFPPADKSLVWSGEQLEKIEKFPFRPFVICEIKNPRFGFDFHTAGGMLGQLYLGLSTKDGEDKWFHDFTEVEASYIDGRMEYHLEDAAFPGVKVFLSAAALSDSVGLALKVNVQGAPKKTSLIWGYGGASAYISRRGVLRGDSKFAPEHCAKDIIQLQNNTVTLSRSFDANDIYSKQVFAVTTLLPGWKTVMRAGSSWSGGYGFTDPNAFDTSPGKSAETALWVSSKELLGKRNCVAIQKIPLTGSSDSGFVLVGLGGDIENTLKNPSKAYYDALKRNKSISNRIVVETPDPYLNEAVTTIAFSTDGLWGDSTILHGAVSWRMGYLGWRGWYGPLCYGWDERIKKSIENQTTLALISEGDDKGAIRAIIEYPGKNVYYNMNEVFLDQTRQYFDYTNDIKLMDKIFPILEGIVEWQRRRLQPNNELLFENALNTWISDHHWYTRGQCTQSSAYMLNAHNLLADLAERLGKNPEPYRQRAKLIRAAMQRKLWMPRLGVFAEYQDTLGNELLHPEPELPTIYHSAEFGAADDLQIYQMLYWADTHLKPEFLPGGEKLIWSSNWFPNYGRSYTHSTRDVVYAEQLNFAMTNYIAGRSDEAYKLLRGTLYGIYNDRSPGGLSCQSFIDGTKRANDDFADGISMWGRTLSEGLFGIAPHRPDGYVSLCPQFPKDWMEASIKTPHFSYKYMENFGEITIEWKSPVKTTVKLKLPLQAKSIEGVRIGNKNINYQTEAGVRLTWLTAETPRAKGGKIRVDFTPTEIAVPNTTVVKQGDSFSITLANYQSSDWLDPQAILKNTIVESGVVKGTVDCEAGPALIFLSSGTTACPVWLPLKLEIEPMEPKAVKIWKAPNFADKDLQRWHLVDLSETFNVSLAEVLKPIIESAKKPALPASTVGFNYWMSHITRRQHPISDEMWRGKVGPDGVGWVTDGIPFKTSKTGANIAVASLAGGYPEKVKFDVNAKGKSLYLMLSGMTFPNQSHVVNICITLNYVDGSGESFDLVSPFDIGDCWTMWRCHDTAANGFENLSGKKGPAGSSEVEDLTKPIAVDTEAHLLKFELKHDTKLGSVELEIIANDIAFGVMGASILK